MNVPNLAYKFRLDYRIAHMPLDCDQLVYILRRNFRILKYSEAEAELVRRECFSCTLELDGFALTDEFDQTTIYISDYIDREKRLSVLLHELGHVICGHCRKLGPVMGYGWSGDPMQEEEANEFARSVLAPVCYLAKLPVQSPEDIQAVTGVRKRDAQQLYKDVLKYRKEAHLVTQQEKSLIKMMNGAEDRPSFHRGQKCLKRVAAASFIALAVILGICCCAPYFNMEENLPAYSSSGSQNYGGSVSMASAEGDLDLLEENSQPVSASVPDTGLPKVGEDQPEAGFQQGQAPSSSSGTPEQGPVPPGGSQVTQDGQAQKMFWATQYGECYHREDCFHLYGRDNMRELTRQEALEDGLRPCKDCRPDEK